ncbi:MAG: PPC domain-containing DNA-binding protein [Candidatus Zixiibacteriota bacterium]
MKFKKHESGYAVRLEKGEDVLVSLTRFANEVKLGSGSVIGIGVVCDVELGYFDPEANEYIKKNLDGEYELITFMGNFSVVDGERFVHAHVTVSDRDCRPYAGHLFSGVIGVTGEFTVTASDIVITRSPDPDTGLKFLDL